MKQVFITTGLVFALAVPAAAFAQSGQTTPKTGPAHTPKTQTPKPETTQKKAPGTMAGAQATGGTLDSIERRFVTEAAVGGLAEVELGRLAADRASDADVKQFGQRMVDDHGKANDELKSWASKNNVTLPTELDAKHKATQERLSKLSGAAFDRAYMAEMVRDHTKDVSDFKTASRTSKNADLKAWAGKTLPVLEEHLTMAKTTDAKVGGAKSQGTAKK